MPDTPCSGQRPGTQSQLPRAGRKTGFRVAGRGRTVCQRKAKLLMVATRTLFAVTYTMSGTCMGQTARSWTGEPKTCRKAQATLFRRAVRAVTPDGGTARSG